ncbi:MAG: cytochrome b/b6 domain-containing protein [Sphingomonadaceae bacterium]
MTGSAEQLVWDLPTRQFHWMLALALPLCWWTAEYGHMTWHRRLGLAVCLLIVFRIAWGVIGTQTSRFGYFVKGPRAVMQYLRGRETKDPAEAPGHSPLGALSVIAMIAAIAAQVSLGLIAVDVDGLESGPLSGLVSYRACRTAAGIASSDLQRPACLGHPPHTGHRVLRGRTQAQPRQANDYRQ